MGSGSGSPHDGYRWVMRRFALLIAVVLTAAACSTTTDGPASTTSTSIANSSSVSSTSVAATGISVPPQLVGYEVRDVQVGDRTLTLAVADSPSLRARGLMEVESLEDLDGMLFYWRHDAGGNGFWMKDTLIPLDVVFFLEDGTFAGRASMEPCPPDAATCPTYDPGEGVDYRLAIEANPGDLDWIDQSTVIAYDD